MSEFNYQIKDIKDLPILKRAKYLSLYEKIDYDKMAVFEYDNKETAHTKYIAIRCAIRPKKRGDLPYIPHVGVNTEPDSKTRVYVWKTKLENK